MKRPARVEIFGERYSVSDLKDTGIYFHSNNTENSKTILFVNDKEKKTANFWNYSTMSAIISFDGNQNTLSSERDVFKISLFV